MICLLRNINNNVLVSAASILDLRLAIVKYVVNYGFPWELKIIKCKWPFPPPPPSPLVVLAPTFLLRLSLAAHFSLIFCSACLLISTPHLLSPGPLGVYLHPLHTFNTSFGRSFFFISYRVETHWSPSFTGWSTRKTPNYRVVRTGVGGGGVFLRKTRTETFHPLFRIPIFINKSIGASEVT